MKKSGENYYTTNYSLYDYLIEKTRTRSVLLETSVGDIVVDLFHQECPKAAKNFIKLCKSKFYNNCLFNKVEKGHLAHCGDPDKDGGHSAWYRLADEKVTFYSYSNFFKLILIFF